MSLQNFSNAALLAELERRQTTKDTKPAPVPVEHPDFTEVINLCTSHLDDIKNRASDEDTKAYIYEAAMEAVFGKGVFDWISNCV